MAKDTEQDPLASIANVFRIVGAVLAALAIILGIVSLAKHGNVRLGIAAGVVGLVGVAAIVAAGQFNTSTYADRLGENASAAVRRTVASGGEEKFVRSTNAAEDHRRSEAVVENFRNLKKLPEVACKIKLDDGEICHYTTPARFEKASNGTFLVTSKRVIFMAQGIFNAAELKTVTQLIKYDSGAVGIATKQSLLPDVYDVAYPGELLTFASLACMAKGIQAPPIEHV